MHTTARERKLERARLDGYLNAIRGDAEALREYGFWCWRRRLPLVWIERRSGRSKYARVRLDLFTTAIRLTDGAQAELAAAGHRATVSAHDGVWDRVAMGAAEGLARAVFRIATREGNFERLRRAPPPEIVRMFEEIRQTLPRRKSA
jgi:hypothetical protein